MYTLYTYQTKDCNVYRIITFNGKVIWLEQGNSWPKYKHDTDIQTLAEFYIYSGMVHKAGWEMEEINSLDDFKIGQL